MPEKIANATAVDKALYLYELLLFSNRRYSALDLANILQCSKSTVSRLLRQIETRKGTSLHRDVVDSREWYSLDSPVERARLTCSQDEIEALRHCTDLAKPQLPEGKYDDLAELVDRLHAIFIPSPDAVGETVCPASRSWVDYTASRPILGKLLEAIHSHKICTITYQKGALAPRTWDIAPARLIASSDALYIEGWSMQDALHDDNESHKKIMICVQRIKKVVITGRRHSLLFPDDGKHYFGIMTGSPFQVSVHFDASVADYVRERHYSDDQEITEQPDGSLILHFTACSSSEVISWLLSYGASAEILAPTELRQRLSCELQDMLRRNSGEGSKAATSSS